MIKLRYKYKKQIMKNKGEEILRAFSDNFFFLGEKRGVCLRMCVIQIFLVMGFVLLISAFLVSANNQPITVIKNNFFPAERLRGIMIVDEGKIPLYWEKELIEEIAQRVANEREYKLHVYDCTEFSKKLVRELKKLNFSARCTAGSNWDFEYSDHTWVSVFLDGERIEVEATDGYIIDEEDFESYEIKWEGRCW